MSQPYERSGGSVKVELDLSNYPTTAIDTARWHQKQITGYLEKLN